MTKVLMTMELPSDRSHEQSANIEFANSIRCYSDPMVEEMLAARSIIVSHETVRQWARKFGQDFANRIRRRLPCAGDT